ncbi:hypothetical protein [Tahibacter amnicola]|uniref:DUF4142 domain-containing protein n=1 Tax=Tahibacter amnicola TaxID=2976241 RepID=A0ABY6BRS2_9GAMM|nr:hypothetical protein [Tahibacter amnicola]UXI70467.1 hypothetical protein N4264_12770 [Tahibacter amnicola]
MPIRSLRRVPAAGMAGVCLMVATATAFATERPASPPSGKAPAIQAPVPSKPRAAPTLAAGSAKTFVDFAASSTMDEAESVRSAIASARADAERVAAEICSESRLSGDVDHGRALVALAVLGELRTEASQACFNEWIARPLPQRGTRIDGEIQESVALETLQAKAVDGLAYLQTETANAEVLRIAGEHPSRIVRAEAIAAFLWNHKHSREARQRLLKVVKPDEQIFLDRVTRVAGEEPAAFNARLEAYLKAHPEVRPEAPTRGTKPLDDHAHGPSATPPAH